MDKAFLEGFKDRRIEAKNKMSGQIAGIDMILFAIEQANPDELPNMMIHEYLGDLKKRFEAESAGYARFIQEVIDSIGE